MTRVSISFFGLSINNYNKTNKIACLVFTIVYFLILFSIQSWQYLCCYKKNLLLNNKKKRIFPSYPILKLHWFVQNAVHVIPRVYDSYTCTFNEIGFSVFVLAYSNMASLFFWNAAFAPLSKLFCLKSDITLL